MESAVQSVKKAMEYGLEPNMIIVSTKISEVPEMVSAYEMLAERIEQPLHVGLTEAGVGSKGIVASSAALGMLLSKGIGDTIRVSLTPTPDTSRAEEVIVAGRYCSRWHKALHAAGIELPGMRKDHINSIPGDGAGADELSARARCLNGRRRVTRAWRR